ncbi:MAG: beta-mannosidase [Polaromonas sp.]|nr:beta-mannosidase [Polaromonas sp.]
MILSSACRPQRQPLLENWQVCAVLAGTPEPPTDNGAWLELATLMPAAAALTQAGRWSLDGAPLAFDAQDWWYRLSFDAPGRAAGLHTLLGFDGLATLAEVRLNGRHLLDSSNMFVAHECEVAERLQPLGNELLIRFSALDAALAVKRPRPRWRVPMLPHQQLRWIRTTLLGRTPGWSPPAPVVGPWKDVWLERLDRCRVEDLDMAATLEGSTGVLRCSLAAFAEEDQPVLAASLVLERQGRVHVACLRVASGRARFEGEMRLPDADLWWPHTHGEPALYNVALRLQGPAAGVTTLSLGQVGFRNITVGTADGGFALKVNGVPVFCRGACWTPLDVLTLRSSREACHAALAQARAAGMNMLRIAGTTVYEEDHFYASCDALGMLVWQDFMFASMDYPADDGAFTASALLEVRQQLRRLQSAACLAVLCGNSEVGQQAAMWGAPAEFWQPALFSTAIAGVCAELVPGTPYWPSSAHGGAFPHQANAGSTSYYGVGAYLRPLDDARRAGLRFASECLAFANVPGPTALERMQGGLAVRAHHAAWKQRSPRDLGAGWDFDDVRDHYLGAVFNTDPQQLRFSDHAHYLTLSRMATGEAMAAAFSEWRRPGSSCSGALVLFLRDFWAGAGWGLLDDEGRPKACHHYLQRVLQPVTVLLSDEGVSGLLVHVLNEGPEALDVALELMAWRDGEVRVGAGRTTLRVPPHGTRSVSGVQLLGHFMDLTHAYRFGPLACDVVTATLSDLKGVQLAQAFHFPGGRSAARKNSIGLSAVATLTNACTAEVVVQTQQCAEGVYFDVPGFYPEDEYFHLPPGGRVRVTLRADAPHPFSGTVHAANALQGAGLRLEEDAASSATTLHHGEQHGR